MLRPHIASRQAIGPRPRIDDSPPKRSRKRSAARPCIRCAGEVMSTPILGIRELQSRLPLPKGSADKNLGEFYGVVSWQIPPTRGTSNLRPRLLTAFP
jgi:hypothetical protein